MSINRQSANKLTVKKLFDNSKRLSHRVHFIGIGGVSMYSLALLSLKYGFLVSGSDREESDRTRALVLRGIKVDIGNSPESVHGATIVVYSHAIQDTDPQLLEATVLGIPTLTRSEYLGILMQKYYRRIGISGSHGKSTTTAILDHIFAFSGYSPTTLSGADLPIGEPLRIGSDSLVIYEACEYKDSFLDFFPTVAIALNLELDHTDYFADIGEIKQSFLKALSLAGDFALINGDDPNLADIKDGIACRTLTYGGSRTNDYSYSITSFTDSGYEFDISHFGSSIGSFRLNIPGVFNVGNATAAIVTALECGLDVESISAAIASFGGIPRRLEYIGNRFGRRVYYDYAHHPTEIAASINTLKSITNQPLTVVFKPHTFSRTRDLWREFISALSLADRVILCDIFSARETPIEGISSSRLADEIGRRAVYLPDEEVVEYLDLHTKGAIALMGAGDLEKIRKRIINGG